MDTIGIDVKRKVLQELMDTMDQQERSGMAPDLMDKPEDPAAMLDEVKSEDAMDPDADAPMNPLKKDDDEDERALGIDPVVMLAKRFPK